jgi:hypothetical protein
MFVLGYLLIIMIAIATLSYILLVCLQWWGVFVLNDFMCSCMETVNMCPALWKRIEDHWTTWSIFCCLVQGYHMQLPSWMTLCYLSHWEQSQANIHHCSLHWQVVPLYYPVKCSISINNVCNSNERFLLTIWRL